MLQYIHEVVWLSTDWMIKATVTCLYAYIIFACILILWISDTLLVILSDSWIVYVFEWAGIDLLVLGIV